MLNEKIYKKAIEIETEDLIDFGKKFSQGRNYEVVLIPVLIEQTAGEELIEYTTNGKFLKTYNDLVREKKK